MAEKNQNQYTMPPLTQAEVVDRFKQVCALGRFNKKKDDHDWLALFVEWIRTEPSQFANVGLFLKAKGVHPGSIQGRGGRTLWNQSRQSVRQTALGHAIEKTPELLERRFERELQVNMKAITVAEKMLKNLEELTDSPDAGIRHLTSKQDLKALAESLAILAKINLELSNNGVQKHQIESVNLHATIVQSIKERDARMGVQEPGGPG